MSRDMGCRGLLEAGLASPHPSPLDGCPVVALRPVHFTQHNTTHDPASPLGGEHPLQDHGEHSGGSLWRLRRHTSQRPTAADYPRSQPVVKATVNVFGIETSKKEYGSTLCPQ
jgi:hypothetical protein